jgi:hypothetical protein
MTAFIIVAALTSAVLGTRFKIFVVIPLTIFSCTVIAGWAVFTNADWTTVGTGFLCAVVGIQLGYLVGLSLNSIATSDPVAQRHSLRRAKKSRRDQAAFR